MSSIAGEVQMPANASARTLSQQQAYDPHDNRISDESTVGNLATFTHLVKGALGTGILAMPKAFSYTGWVLGLFLTFVVTSMGTVGILLVINAQYVLCTRDRIPYLTYPKAAQSALETGPKCLRCLRSIAVPFVDGFLLFYQLGICSIYIVFMGTNLKHFVETNNDVEYNVRVYYLAFLVPCLLIMTLPNLRKLTPVSAIANILMFVALVIVFSFLFKGMEGVKDRVEMAKAKEISMFIPICLFALESVGVIMAVESSMSQPKRFQGFCGIFSKSMMLIGAIYAAVGMLGYWRYGDLVQGSITVNLDGSYAAVKVARSFVMVAVFLSYGLQGYVVVDIVWNNYAKPYFVGTSQASCVEYTIRYGFVICSFLMAALFVRLEILIGFVGALCLSFLGFIVPAMMDICINHPDSHGPLKFRLVRDIIFIAFGSYVLFMGISMNVRDLVKSYKN